eukprot:TRINITY_DN3594_c0_g1_i1.p1 TRINITY_DN3594_c0_g1~~TRINITY_DN3594_c0_g1_i1.p1  ORF type:complete len:204 (+),score=32.55 TRINITY_DN3594_c0_g1_i1:909-1520(+)
MKVLWYIEAIVAILCMTTLATTTDPDPDWVALFFDESSIAHCIEHYTNSTIENEIYCDHITIAFDPPNMTYYEQYFGLKEKAKLLGYVKEKHDQAILVNIKGELLSTNKYPHTTVSSYPLDPYGAVYSNILWERVDKTSPVDIVFKHGVPDKILTELWTGLLPRYDPYPEALTIVKKIERSLDFSGTVCAFSHWDSEKSCCKC